MEPIPDQTTIAEIQNIIADYYNNNSLNLKYVLLIGNSRHTQISPEVYFADSVFFPFYTVHCDAYWNTNGWDVVTDDPYTSNLTSRGPVYLGRVPVNSVTEINNYINKLQTYYQASVNYSLAKDREILLNLDVDFPNNGCRGSLVTTLNNNLINGHIPGNVSKAVLKVSEHTNGNDAFTYSAARDNLFISTLNSGASIMSILSTNWSRDTLGSWFNIHSAFSSLNNTVMPFLIGTSCNVGGVNDSNITDNCMRKLLVCPGGGIIGAVAPTSGTEQHINGDVLNLFHDLVFQTITPTYSEILPILKNYLATNDPYWSFYYKSFIFFGDPSMYPSIYKHITTDPLTATTWSGNIVLDGPITVSA
ncbi:MAG: C25 family cysteine peptidase, partial [Legionella sp.]|uniref:C25 family cysteine peptidase n=1 Tax=Legionella sp. TaxID=459 RepID=UPI002840FA46|nr:C25 family cysteine peptidase [Legionella sp.]